MKKKPRKKIKEFSSILDTCYTAWLGERDSFECEVCGEDLEYPQKKCTYCGSTFKYEHAVLRLVRPVVDKRKDPPSYTMPSGVVVDKATGKGDDGRYYTPEYKIAPGLVGPPVRVNSLGHTYTPDPIPIEHSWSFKKWWNSSKGWRRLIP